MFDMYVFYVVTIIQWEHFCLFVFFKYLLYFFIYLFTYVCIYSINNIQSI